jgi:competence protein ComEC
LILAAGVGVFGLGRLGWLPAPWRRAGRSRIWLVAGVVGLLASGYFHWRLPQPSATDVSRLLTGVAQGEVSLQGEVESLPRLTRSGQEYFWLTVQRVEEWTGPTPQLNLQTATGRVYVTASQAAADRLQPGQRIRVRGRLSAPKPSTNPGGFDFQAFLRQQNSFAALRGNRIEVLNAQVRPGLWQVQQRMVRSQAQWIPAPEAAVISAMVLGSRAVDLPVALKDKFAQVGLAHALAASGFQTSLILGVVLALCCHWSERLQFTVGTLALGLFVGLSGGQAPVLRAALMGFGGLVALVLGRKIRPLGSLLVTATLLLLVHPLWVFDLGFQLSFLATLGLLVSVPAIAGYLDWLPSGLTPSLAVPLAAYLWTLPLCLYAFGVVSPYSIPANLLTTPLVTLLSLGGMVSGVMGLVWAPLGSGSAWLLQFPARLLIALVDGFSQLPGSAWALGTISVLLAIALYGLIGLTWLQTWWQRHWWVALVVGVGLVSIPAWQTRLAQFQVTILATASQPTLVVQDAGRTGLIQTSRVAPTTVLPFLQRAGVNRLDWALPLDPAISADRGAIAVPGLISTGPTSNDLPSNTWHQVASRLPIRMAYSLPSSAQNMWQNAARRPESQAQLQPGQATPLGRLQMTLLQRDPAVVVFQMRQRTWLWMASASLPEQAHLLQSGRLAAVPKGSVLWWSGQALSPALLERVRPAVAIASAPTVHPDTVTQLRRLNVQTYWTGRDGALQWTPESGFQTTLNVDEGTNGAL